ncbi:MAG: hypothetical protein P4M08_01330 [Oligoflexia bacterium]|nr:hypothetical protein [Oligoflexia bacterium]
MIAHTLIDLDEIVVREDRFATKRMSMTDFMRVQNGINQVGHIIQPIGVTPKGPDGKHTLIFGLARYLAYCQNREKLQGSVDPAGTWNYVDKSLIPFSGTPVMISYEHIRNFSKIPAIILTLDTSDTLQIEWVSLLENFSRRDLHPLELSEILCEFKRRYEEEHPEARLGATGGGRNGEGTRTKTQIADSANPVESFVDYFSGILPIKKRTIYELIFLGYLDNIQQRARFRENKMTKSTAIQLARKSRATMKGRTPTSSQERRRDAERARMSKTYKDAVDLHGSPRIQHPNSEFSQASEDQVSRLIALTDELRRELKKAFYCTDLIQCTDSSKRRFLRRMKMVVYRSERMMGIERHLASLRAGGLRRGK